jgi:hypothetical protein
MKKCTLLAIGLVFGATFPAVAQQCAMSKLQNSSGATLSLITGQGYMVNPGYDRAAVGLWAPLDKVQICRAGGSSYKLTNLSKTPPVTITVYKMNR